MNNRELEQALAEAQATLAAALAERDALKAKADKPAERGIFCKVSEKGAVSLYGVNAKWPVTLYGDQWARVLDKGEMIRAFILANKATLSFKPVAGKVAEPTTEPTTV